jgi:hypothetical protein
MLFVTSNSSLQVKVQQQSVGIDFLWDPEGAHGFVMKCWILKTLIFADSRRATLIDLMILVTDEATEGT